MTPLPFFSPEGEAALAALLRLKPLLAFDFDGTLAPIVEQPEHARIDPEAAALLARLGRLLPVAVITGRSVADVRPRLGFEPRYVVGNHGAEDDAHRDPLPSRALQVLRDQLQRRAADLANAGVRLEDKGASLALHYRQAPDAARAMMLIDELMAPARDTLRVFGGKMVVNAMALGAPDKAQALQRLLAASGAAGALFAGDDLNDEPVFEAAPAHWVTVRVGPARWPTRARFEIDGPAQMPVLLHRLDQRLAEAT